MTGCVDGCGRSRVISEQAERRAVIHQFERLVFAAIEAAGLVSVSVEDVLLQNVHVLRNGSTGEDRRCSWWQLSWRAGAWGVTRSGDTRVGALGCGDGRNGNRGTLVTSTNLREVYRKET